QFEIAYGGAEPYLDILARSDLSFKNSCNIAVLEGRTFCPTRDEIRIISRQIALPIYVIEHIVIIGSGFDLEQLLGSFAIIIERLRVDWPGRLADMGPCSRLMAADRDHPATPAARCSAEAAIASI